MCLGKHLVNPDDHPKSSIFIDYIGTSSSCGETRSVRSSSTWEYHEKEQQCHDIRLPAASNLGHSFLHFAQEKRRNAAAFASCHVMYGGSHCDIMGGKEKREFFVRPGRIQVF